MNKKILFVNCSVYLPGEHALKRTMYLFEMMHDKNLNVEFLTSDFNHYTKKMRDILKFREMYPEYNTGIGFIHVPEYDNNISVRRFYSNYLFEKRAMKYIREHIDEYGAVYLSLPVIYMGGPLSKLWVQFVRTRRFVAYSYF